MAEYVQNNLTIDLSNVAAGFKKTLKLKSGYDNRLIIQNANINQIVYSKSGANLVATIYTSPDKTSVLGTVTLTNGNSLTRTDEKVRAYVYNDNEDEFITNFRTLSDIIFEPTKKTNTYTGSWLTEHAESTENNETFNLGSGQDFIDYNLSKNQGKDTIVLNKGEQLFLQLQNGEGYLTDYLKKGNDLVFSASTEFNHDKSLDYYKGTYKITPPATSDGDYKYTYTIYALQDDYYSTYNTNGTTYKGTVSTTVYNFAMSYMKSHNIDLELILNEEVTFYIGVTAGTKFNIPKALNNGTAIELFQSIKFNSYHDPAAISAQLNLKNYFLYDGQIVDTANLFNTDNLLAVLNNTNYNKSNANKSQTITDTFLSNEVIKGSIYADKITSSKGDDSVTGGKGNDKIYLSNGIKTLNYNKDDGNDTVYITEGTEVIFNFGDNPENIYYTIKGNDLLVHTSDNIQTGDNYMITLNNYFKKFNNIIISGDISQNDVTEYFNENYYNFENSNDQHVIKDTTLTERIVGGNNIDKITSAGGDDEITAGKGNDIITLSNGNKVLNFNKGDNQDSVSIGKNTSVILNFQNSNDGLIYSKSGNNLVINRKLTNEYAETGRYTADTNDSVTVKNYFTNKYTISVNHGTTTEIPDFLNSSFLSLYGSDSKKNEMKGTKYNEHFYAGNETTKISAGEGKNTILQSKNGKNLTITAGKNNDEYIINDLNHKVTITDNGGSDCITVAENITENKTAHIIYDIKKDGTLKECSLKLFFTDDTVYNNNSDFALSLEQNKTETGNYIYNETVKVNNFFKKDGSFGTGCIENISYNFDSIRQDVANWLSENNFASVSEFLKNGSGDNTARDMKELIAIFDSGIIQV